MALDAKTDQNFVILGPRPTPLVRTSDPGGKSRQDIKNSLISKIVIFQSILTVILVLFIIRFSSFIFSWLLEAES